MAPITKVESERRLKLLEDGLKECSGCGGILDLSRFRTGDPSRMWMGFRSRCIGCENAMTADWQRRNPDKANAKARRWVGANREQARAHAKRYRDSPKGQETQKAQYIRNHYVDEAAYELAVFEREMGRVERSAYMRLYGPLISRLEYGRRRTVAACFGARADRIAPESLLAYWDARGIEGSRCFYTGVELGEDWHLEHKFPISRGGVHTVENLVPCSPEANREKFDMSAVDYFAFLELKGNAK